MMETGKEHVVFLQKSQRGLYAKATCPWWPERGEGMTWVIFEGEL